MSLVMLLVITVNTYRFYLFIQWQRRAY